MNIAMVAVTLLAATASNTTAQTVFDAYTRGDIHLVRGHIANGTNVNEASELTGTRPLRYSAYRGNSGIVAKLLQAGADPSTTDDSGWTLLHSATFDGLAEIMTTLLAAGSDATTEGRLDRTPIKIDGQFRITTARTSLRETQTSDKLSVTRQCLTTGTNVRAIAQLLNPPVAIGARIPVTATLSRRKARRGNHQILLGQLGRGL